jgi:hypothetical protein
MHMVLGIVSLLLTLATASLVTRAVALDRAEAFWIFLAYIAIELGTLASALSVFSVMTPVVWIAGQSVLLCATALIVRASRGPRREPSPAPGDAAGPSLRRRLHDLAPTAAIAMLLTAGMLITSAVSQAFTPIVSFDDKMYHASRVIYWIQHHTVLPYVSHNDRQTVYTFGSELFFLWPVLFTRTEEIGRMLFWLAFPLAVAGLFLTIRTLGVTLTAAALAILLFVTTPIVDESALGLKPEIWFVVFLTGLAFWVVRAAQRPHDARAYFFASLFTCLSINVRATAVVLVPLVAAVLVANRQPLSRRQRLTAMAAGTTIGILCSGMLLPFGVNAMRYHNVLGPPALQRVTSSDLSVRQMWTHAVRLPLLLLEVPAVPDTALRAEVSEAATSALTALAANEPLPLERRDGWPGLFAYDLPRRARYFSLGGLAWLPCLVAVAIITGNHFRQRWPALRLTPVALVWLIAGEMLAATVFGVRWMAHSDVPARFMVGPYGLAVCLIAVVVGSALETWRWARALILVLVAWAVVWPASTELNRARAAIVTPVTPEAADEPFTEPLHLMTSSAVILFAGNQDALDYPLFAPREQYGNRVISWGKERFDARRMEDLLRDNGVTHVLIQNEQRLSFHWDPDVSTTAMVEWLSHRDGLFEVPLLVSPGMRLFQRGSADVRAPDAASRTHQYPVTAPLITVDPRFAQRLTIDPALVRLPWPIEHSSDTVSFLWIGSGAAEGLDVILWAAADLEVNVRIDAVPGPSRAAPERTLALRVNGQSADRRSLLAEGTVQFSASLRKGRNPVELWVDEDPSILRQPNGDRRHLMAMIRAMRIEAARP